MHNDEVFVALCRSEQKKTIFVRGMIWIRNKRWKIISENFRCLPERDAVFLYVGARFGSIPFEVHRYRWMGDSTTWVKRPKLHAGKT